MKFMNHPLWHHLLMVVVSEFINIIWLLSALFIIAGGFVVFSVYLDSFAKIAVGMPLIFIGTSILLFKIDEFVGVLLYPKRLESVCKFCDKETGGKRD